MKKHLFKKLILMMLSATLLIGLSVTSDTALANDSYDHTYTKVKEYGYTVDGSSTCTFELKDAKGNLNLAYCVDRDTFIKQDCKYSRVNVGDASYYSKENANHIRAIIQNAYPFITLDELSARSKVAKVTAQEAITAAQLAIWHYSNNSATVSTDKKVKALYDFYIALPAQAESSAKIGKIDLTVTTEKTGNDYKSVVRFKTEAKNVDKSNVAVKLATSKDLKKAYPSVKVVDNGIVNGWHQFTYSNIPENATFDFIASAEQNIAFDGYFYSPEGGKTKSQSLVGAYIGNTTLSSRAAFVPTPGDNTIRIEKIDSVTGAKLPGAEFMIGDKEDFSGVNYTVVTGQDGTATQAGLKKGKWYVKETKAPNGYISYETPFVVSVGHGITIAQCKNTAFGSIEILKVDENQKPVAGAVFDIYKGDKATGTPLYTGLVSDKNGIILKGNVEPGVYTLVETKAPQYYHINKNAVTITVKPGKKASVSIVNKNVQKGHLNLVKRDAQTDELLAGSVIGVYEDKECTKEIGRFTSLVTGPVSTKDLYPGTYYAKEIKAPKDFQLDSTVQEIVLHEGETLEVTFRNTRTPHTAGNYAMIFMAGLMMLGGCSITAIVFRKKLLRH